MHLINSQRASLALLSTFALLTPSLQAAIPDGSFQRPSTSPITIYQYPNGTWAENLAERQNGDLLVSIIGRPELHLLRTSTKPATDSILHTFPGTNAVFGISEFQAEVFAVITGNFTLNNGSTPGTYSVWSVDFRGREKEAKIEKIADVPEGGLLNGLTTLNERALLISDSWNGNVLRLDVETGHREVVLDDASMKPVPGASVRLGINGVKVHDSYLYYSNTFQTSLSRVKVDCESGKAAGPFETISKNTTGIDDFDVAADGTAYVAQNFINDVARVTANGVVTTIAGNLNSSAVAGPTAAVVGRGNNRVLYVTTSGGLANPINGTYIEGGKILAIGI